jgi:hypothetical protein
MLAAAPALATEGGGSLVLAAPGGALGEQANIAGGLAGDILLASTPSGTLALRAGGSWLLYGSETVRIPVAGTAGRLVRDITTENWMAQVGLGPQVAFPVGGVRAYLHAFVGAAYLSTTSDLRDPDGFVSASSTNYDDTAVSYGGGAGVLAPVGRGGTAVDVGVRYVRTGTVRFLAEGDLGAAGGAGAVHQGQANVFEFRLGLAFGSRSRTPRH